uniref:hypothetical protein n=1 Tax=Catenella fusiformis TaxID=3024791 RepID=UPI0027DA71A5|nr:hypothetical protein REQ04_pgp120 [Catenella fusiformis]WCH57507.1 hypothetical protein [Catenella fusiformis]
MEKPLEIFIKSSEGVWKSQQTIYDFTTKTSSINKLDIKVCLLNTKNLEQDLDGYICQYKQKNYKKIIYKYSASKNSCRASGTLKKIYKNIIKKYIFKVYHHNYLKVQYLNSSILYTEYTYFIHKNIKLSVLVIKKFNLYTAACFTSAIKIIKT